MQPLPKKRDRIPTESIAGLAAASLLTDGVKAGVIMIPFVGILINWFFIAPVSFIGFTHTFSMREVHFMERGMLRFIIYIVFGGIPLSTTVGTIVTIAAVRLDDARYNKRIEKMGIHK